jgi:hypothetical protein
VTGVSRPRVGPAAPWMGEKAQGPERLTGSNPVVELAEDMADVVRRLENCSEGIDVAGEISSPTRTLITTAFHFATRSESYRDSRRAVNVSRPSGIATNHGRLG